MATVLPIVVGDNGLPSVQPANGIFPEDGFAPENKLSSKYTFDRTIEEGTFKSRISGAELIVPANGVYRSDAVRLGRHVSISSAQKAGLKTELKDTRAMTYGGVFYYDDPDPSDAHQTFVGSRSSTVSGGEIIRVNTSGDLILEVQGLSSVMSITKSELAAAGVASGQWVFVMKTAHITEGVTEENTFFLGTPNGPITRVEVGSKSGFNGLDLAIGNAYRTDDWAQQNIRCASFVGGKEHFTVEEMDALYRMQKVMMARRGVEVF